MNLNAPLTAWHGISAGGRVSLVHHVLGPCAAELARNQKMGHQWRDVVMSFFGF